jgi:hypothetical protein
VRFLSKYANYQICFQRDILEHYATGESRVLKPLINIEFATGIPPTSREAQIGRDTFINYGTQVELDRVTAVDPLSRFAVWDSELYQSQHPDLVPDTNTRRKIEQWLIARPEHGIDYLAIETQRTPPPWPNYDEFRGVRGSPTGPRIAERVLEDGYDVEAVLAYERENLNRQEVIDALEALNAAEPEPEAILVDA